MRWTKQQLEEYETRRASSSPKPKPPVRHEPVATEAGKSGDANRVHVRIVSFRRKLCDPDNLCPKYFIDCLRYAEIIADDRPQDITLEVRQEKVKHKEDECTVIEIEHKENLHA